MKTMVNLHDFRAAFKRVRPNSFSYEGITALFNYLEEYEADTGEELELDVIGLCCDFTEYEDIAEYNEEYNTEHESPADITEAMVIPISDESFIVWNW